MKRLPLLFLLSFLATGLIGCPFFGFGSSSGGGKVTRQEREVSNKIAIALGGMAAGTDDYLFEDPLTTLELQNEDEDLFSLEPLEGFSNFAGGKGARIVPQEGGIGYFVPSINGRSRNPVEVVIPPQKLIQILVGEARGELAREATLQEEMVKDSSVSVTGDAVASVIRNRIDQINETGLPGLFVVDSEEYARNPPLSYYDAVIEANDGVVYQFSPVEPSDPSHEAYQSSERREPIATSLEVAYDQAVLTAAFVFNEDTDDPTGGAFAFYSPTEAQFSLLQEAQENQDERLPEGAGTSDAQFPALAPIQVVILPDSAPSVTNTDIPSFVFIRSRQDFEPAVTEEP